MSPATLANELSEGTALPPYLANRSLKNSYWYFGHLFSILLRAEHTNARFSLIHANDIRGNDPPLHTHTREDEVFVLLEGEMEFYVAGQTFRAHKGDVMFLPKNVAHAWKILTETAEVLMQFSPGGFENYFIEMSEPAPALQLPPPYEGPIPVDKIMATATKYGIRFPTSKK
jgi:quercetin dioxygenase-like cupin family protein